MKRRTLSALTVLVLPALALANPQAKVPGPQDGVIKYTNITLTFIGGELEMLLPKAGGYGVKVWSGASGKRVGLKSDDYELLAATVTASTKPTVVAKKRQTALVGATASGNVYFLGSQLQDDGTKRSYKVTCDDAVFKAGETPKTGRIDFKGQVHIWVFDPINGEVEQTAESAWIELGDPIRIHFGSGQATGKLSEKPAPAKGKS